MPVFLLDDEYVKEYVVHSGEVKAVSVLRKQESAETELLSEGKNRILPRQVFGSLRL